MQVLHVQVWSVISHKDIPSSDNGIRVLLLIIPIHLRTALV